MGIKTIKEKRSDIKMGEKKNKIQKAIDESVRTHKVTIVGIPKHLKPKKTEE